MKLLKTIGLILATGCAAQAYGQGPVDISELTVPTSPGFVLLDHAPATIEKPTTPKALGIDVLNLFTKNEGAIDVTPYWLLNHPKYTFQNWISETSPVLQTLNFSVAGAKSDTGSYMAVGVRTQLLRIYSKKQRQAIDNKVQEIVMALSVDPDALDTTSLKGLRQDLGALQGQSTLNVELAGAVSGLSNNSRFQDLNLNRTGIWLNAKYQPSKIPLSVLGLAKYTRVIAPSELHVADSSYLDLGLALSYQQDNFDLQFEYIRRYDMEYDEAYHRVTLVANYMVAKNLVVVASLGKNFAGVDNIVALFGVKFGLSRQTVQ